MNQVFRIAVGPETLEGRLPARRVAQHFACRFHISGVPSDAVSAPKIWITTETGSVLYWVGTFDGNQGVWVIDVNTDASETVGSYLYSLTVTDNEDAEEYNVGQGAFTVYSTIASGGETGGTSGASVYELLLSIDERLQTVEGRFEEMSGLAMFDPESAFDIELRQQVQSITNLLRGS